MGGSTTFLFNGTNMMLGATAVPGATGAVEKLVIRDDANTRTTVEVINNTSGTAATVELVLSNSATLSGGFLTGLYFRSISAGYTTSGINIADTAVFLTNKAAGFNQGTTINTQFSFWTNNLERARFLGTGQFLIGGTAQVISEQLLVRTDANAATRATICNATSGSGAFAQLLVTPSSTGATYAVLTAFSAGFTSSGIAELNTAGLYSNQSAGFNIGTNISAQLSFWTNNVKVISITGTGRTFFGGSTTATALIHIAAGTATASTAPLKFTTGTNLTVAEAGVMEYNGNHYLSNATLRFSAGGVLPFNNFADVSVGGLEADIYSATLLANTFNANGDKVVSMYGGNFVTVGTELTQLKVLFAGTTIWDSTGVAPTTGTTSWRVTVEIIRVSATVVRYTVSLNTTGASGFVYCTSGELAALTLSNTNILKLTGTSSGVGSGVGDIVGKMGFIEFKPTH